MGIEKNKKYFPTKAHAGTGYVASRWKKSKSLKTLKDCDSFGAANAGRVYTQAERDAWAKENGYL